MKCFFVSDLHGQEERYKKLFNIIHYEKPNLVFIGGDLMPSYTIKISSQNAIDEFLDDFFIKNLIMMKKKMEQAYPQIFIILGNDDLKTEEEKLIDAEKLGILKYINLKKVEFENVKIFGYSYVPPTPFLLKDWEKYDVSRYVDPGCVSPEEGFRSVSIDENEIKFSTIKNDLDNLTANEDLSNAVFLFHSPPYKTNLDRIANDGKFFEHVPLDLYAGSIAIKKMIETKQPLLTLHGHIHESTRLTGQWKDKIGNTFCFNSAHDGPELSLIEFDLCNLPNAKRILI